ncbi:MAG: hypothetical protein WDN06_11680 [Asticcacaulis sp.]
MTTQHQTHTARPRPNLRVITPQTTNPPLFSRRELRRLVAEMID